MFPEQFGQVGCTRSEFWRRLLAPGHLGSSLNKVEGEGGWSWQVPIHAPCRAPPKRECSLPAWTALGVRWAGALHVLPHGPEGAGADVGDWARVKKHY